MAARAQYERDGEANRRKETHRFPWRCEILHDYILGWRVQSNVGEPRMPLRGYLRGVIFVLWEEQLDQRLST